MHRRTQLGLSTVLGTTLLATGCTNPSSRSSAPGSSAGGGLAIAVLPFVARSSDDESKALADGLTDDITSGLSRFGYLRVLAMNPRGIRPGPGHADQRAFGEMNPERAAAASTRTAAGNSAASATSRKRNGSGTPPASCSCAQVTR